MHNSLKSAPNQNHYLPPKSLIYNPISSLIYALNGILMGFRREPNLSVQTILGLSTAVLLIYNKMYTLAVLDLIMMFFTLSAEFFNTAIETLCDLVHPDFSLKVKLIKDFAAAGVLTIALGWLTFLIYCGVILYFHYTV